MKKTFFILFNILFIGVLSYAQGLPSPERLEPFMDGVIETLMDEKHINGVTVSVVQGDSIYWSKGYGYADSKNNISVDPSTTLFRMGSVSKLFVWTAVMQLYEAGLINLDADVSSYIDDFEIPGGYDEPITMRHLMTHTPGFEDYYFNLFSTDSLPPESLGANLNKHMPRRVRPPGVHASYSNHGTGIAAYIVEKISRLKWDDYVEQKILRPLGMDITSFRYVLPDSLKVLHSNGYKYVGGTYVNKEFKGIPLAPVGLACTSADDMTPFMLAHLNHGEYNGYRMLDSVTVDMMHTQIFEHAEGLNGMCYGFFNHSKNGYKVVGHGGATEFFFTLMLLLPDEKTGIFISTNTQGGTSLVRDASNQWMDKYYPDTTSEDTLQLSSAFLNQFNGDYIANRRPMNRVTKIAVLTNNPIKVTNRSGNIITTVDDDTHIWFPIDSFLFQNINSTSRIAFGKNSKGKTEYLFLGGSPHTAFERVKTLDSKMFNIMILLWSAGLGLIGLMIWGATALYRKIHKVRDRKILPLLSKVLVGLNVLFILLFLLLAVNLLSSNDFIFSDATTYAYVVFSLPLIIGIISLLILFMAFNHFKRPLRWRSRIFYFLIATGMIAITCLFYYWDLLGYNF